MSNSVDYEDNIDFCIAKRVCYPIVFWTTKDFFTRTNVVKYYYDNVVVFAKVSDELFICMFSSMEDVPARCPAVCYAGWPIEIRTTLRKAKIDYLAITKEVCGVSV